MRLKGTKAALGLAKLTVVILLLIAFISLSPVSSSNSTLSSSSSSTSGNTDHQHHHHHHHKSSSNSGSKNNVQSRQSAGPLSTAAALVGAFSSLVPSMMNNAPLLLLGVSALLMFGPQLAANMGLLRESRRR